MRRQPSIPQLAARWWDECHRLDVDDKQWSLLRVEDADGLQSQQRTVDRRSAELLKATQARMAELLMDLGVSNVASKHCVAVKLLRSPPGASAQLVHWDQNPDKPLLDDDGRPIPGTKKAEHCVSIILHLNPGATKGTYVPKATAVEVPNRIAAGLRSKAHCEQMRVREFGSHSMDQGDALLFYQDLPHYGPEQPDVSTPKERDDINNWRWVLFLMYSPQIGANQDAHQITLPCVDPDQ